MGDYGFFKVVVIEGVGKNVRECSVCGLIFLCMWLFGVSIVFFRSIGSFFIFWVISFGNSNFKISYDKMINFFFNKKIKRNNKNFYSSGVDIFLFFY